MSLLNTRIALGAIIMAMVLLTYIAFFHTECANTQQNCLKKRESKVGQAIEEVASNLCQMVPEDEIRVAESNSNI